MRTVLLVIAISGSVFAYTSWIDFLDQGRTLDVFADFKRWLGPTTYQFFSGSKGGFYIRIGQTLERRTENPSGNVRLRNATSGGGLENARSVASTAKSFGLMQEDTLRSTDFMRDHIRVVTPLYLERMHVIYDYKRFKDLIEERDKGAADSSAAAGDVSPRAPVLSDSGERDSDVRYFFEHARISTGPVGSGSRFFARYLLTHCGITDYNDLGLGFSDSLARLGDEDADLKVDVVFTIAGAPLDTVQTALRDDGGRRFRLMSVDPAVIPSLNENYDLRLTLANFQGKYPGGESIATFGSWALLIASRDVSQVAITDTLRELHNAKDDIRRELGLDSEDQFQLSEFNFYDTFTIGKSGSSWRSTRNALVFIVFVFVTSTAIFMFSSWFFSNVSKTLYYRKLTSINETALEDNRSLDWPDENDPNAGFPEPIIHEDQKDIISNLVSGASELAGLTIEVREAYNRGKLSFQHRTQLLNSVDDLRSIYQRHLARRLNEYYSNYGAFNPVILRHYYTAGYLSGEHFGTLDEKYNKPVSASDASFHGPAIRIFISYRRDDSRFAVDRLREQLTGVFSKDSVFQDAVTITPGRDYRDYINQEISRCDILLAIIGPSWTSIMGERLDAGEPDLHRLEIEAGLDNPNISVIPVLLAPARMPSDDELPTTLKPLRVLQHCTIRPDPEFASTVEILSRAIVNASSPDA